MGSKHRPGLPMASEPDSRYDSPSFASSSTATDGPESPCSAGRDQAEKENVAPQVEPRSASERRSAPAMRGARRVHFKPAHDILLLTSVLHFCAHLRWGSPSLDEKWALVQNDVVQAVRKRMAVPTWTACTRTLRERFRRLLADYRARQLREVRARILCAGRNVWTRTPGRNCHGPRPSPGRCLAPRASILLVLCSWRPSRINCASTGCSIRQSSRPATS